MLKKIESRVNSVLMKFPFIKKAVKRGYQLGMYATSSKLKSEGGIQRISPEDGFEYFFGYYDKSPWDAADRYMLSLRAKNTYSSTAPGEKAEIVLFDTEDGNSYRILGETRAWNVQQGCMLQWLGPDYSEKIIYNDFRNGSYCSVILNLNTNEEKIIKKPVYSVSQDGKFALSLDFSRLHTLRKGYGYSNIPDETANEKVPNLTCIWKIDLANGEIKSLLNYTDFANFEPRAEMEQAIHKVNHIMLNPLGTRFMVLHRWMNKTNKYTRLITVNVDGTGMYNLNDDNMTSHCCWKNDHEILAFANKKQLGNGYYLLEDKTQEYENVWPELKSDGHPSYSPDGSSVVTDTYPDRARIAKVYLLQKHEVSLLARVFAPFKYDNDVRCDLHPKWDRNGYKVSIDSTHEGLRALYVINLNSQRGVIE